MLPSSYLIAQLFSVSGGKTSDRDVSVDADAVPWEQRCISMG